MTFISTILFINLLALNTDKQNYTNRPKNCSNTLYLRNSTNTIFRNNTSINIILTNKIEEYNKIILNSSINRYNHIFDKKNDTEYKNTLMFNTLKLLIAKYIVF
jgi:hypothetical protein